MSPVNACQCLCVFLMSNIFTYIDIQNVVSMIYEGLYIKLNKNVSFCKYLNDPALVYHCVLDYNLSGPFWPLWYLHRTVMLYFLEFVLPSWPCSSRKKTYLQCQWDFYLDIWKSLCHKLIATSALWQDSSYWLEMKDMTVSAICLTIKGQRVMFIYQQSLFGKYCKSPKRTGSLAEG